MRKLQSGIELVLASSSPRRKDLLRAVGLPFSVVPANIDEEVLSEEKAAELVRRLAQHKAEAVAALHPQKVVIGADTVVVCGDKILGKPRDEADARSMLRLLRGQTHCVWSGFALCSLSRRICHVEAGVTEVKMASFSDSLIDRYVESGEPMDKAGAYAAQELGMQLIESIRGSYSLVVGLDMCALMTALEHHGLVSSVA